jgi:transposase
MVTEYRSWESWEKAHGRLGFKKVMGMSPGGAAARLGMSRQAVYDLVRRGKLDMVKIKKKEQVRYSEIYVTEESLERELERREKKLDK